jgi:hypothetical protein
MATDLTSLAVTLTLKLVAAVKKTIDLSTGDAPLNINEAMALAFGTAADQADQIWWDRRELGETASENLDLAGSLLNAFGVAVTFSKVKAIIVINRSDQNIGAFTATDAEITVGGAAATECMGPFDAAGDAIKVAAGGMFMVTRPDATGWAVVTGTGDILKVANNDAGDHALYDIVLIGVSA